MSLPIAALVGFLAGRMLWLVLRKTWSRSELLRTNYSGATLPTAAGIVILFTLLLVEAVRVLAAAAGVGESEEVSSERIATLIVVAGFSLIGLIDDLLGSPAARGLGGHLRALLAGELTTGGVKVVGGLLTAIVAAGIVSDGNVGELLVGATLIALAANLANLFDLRPGRASKVGLTALVALLAASSWDAALVPVMVVAGAVAALMLDDLRERLMLGDTGANAMGAAAGLGVVMTSAVKTQLIVVGVLAALNLLSEILSFSKIFERFPPLRAFDKLGRRSPTLDLREPKPPSDSSEPSASMHARSSALAQRPIRATTASFQDHTAQDGDWDEAETTGSPQPYAGSTPAPDASTFGDLDLEDVDFFSRRRSR